MTDDTLPVRLSHLIWECSVGAIVRGQSTLMTVKDTRAWKVSEQNEIRYVEQVRRALRIQQTLVRPPVARIDDQNGRIVGDTVPAMLFPGWTRCARCGLLHHRPWRNSKEQAIDDRSEEIADPTEWYCHGPDIDAADTSMSGPCRGRLEQVPWVFVHKQGYLDEVPWHDLAHRGVRSSGQKACSPEWKTPYLRIYEADHGLEVNCKKCGAKGRIEERFLLNRSMRQQPWIDMAPEDTIVKEDPLGWIVTVSDVRVHTSQTSSALVIPPESRISRGSVVDRLHQNTRLQREIQSARKGLQRRSRIRSAATRLDCEPVEVEEAMHKIEAGYPILETDLPPEHELLPEEYSALTNIIPDLSEDEDFVTSHHTNQWNELCKTLDGKLTGIADMVDQLVAVNRLKEIVVMKGFQRGGSEGELVPPDLDGSTDWRPAVELYGEGIFFTFREDSLRRWERDEDLLNRALSLNERYSETRPMFAIQPEVTPRFLMLHTLSHLIMRELERSAGYPAASMKERIYSATASVEPEFIPMAGILVYVAVADTEGSLGGLVRQAEPESFLRILTTAVESSRWCSFDPVCRERVHHGPGRLNRAACHGCALVPEPACAYNNMMLDRAFVTGERQDTGIDGLFGQSIK